MVGTFPDVDKGKEKRMIGNSVEVAKSPMLTPIRPCEISTSL
jgi:hypothetical protein